MAARTETFENMKQPKIEKMKDAAADLARSGKLLQKHRKRVGEIKDTITDVMTKHEIDRYKDEETGYVFILKDEKRLKIQTPDTDKEGEEETPDD
jgi:hypothetical protein